MEIFLLIIIGIIAGITSGLFGVGGAIVIIPLLIYLGGYGQFLAQGTSLVALLPPVSILAVIEYYKKGNANISAGIIICLAMVIGAGLGAKIANQLPAETMKKIFSIFIIIVGFKMFLGK